MVENNLEEKNKMMQSFRQDLDEHWSSKNNMDLWQSENCSQVIEGWNDKKSSVGSKGDCKSEEEDARLC